MRARPKRWLSGGIRTIATDSGIIVELDVDGPPSMVGRELTLWLDDAEVTELLLVLRIAAGLARSRAVTS